MDKSIHEALKLIKSEEFDKDIQGRCEVSETEKPDVELLDAYSRAVITVVDAIGPAVVSISVGRQSQWNEENIGVGSGVIIAPDGYILVRKRYYTLSKYIFAG